MLAKGRLLGIQYEEILRDGLYRNLAAHANQLAKQLSAGLEKLGIPLLVPAESNQVFPIFPDEIVDSLRKEAAFETERKMDESLTCIRFVTAWHTSSEDVDALLNAIRKHFS